MTQTKMKGYRTERKVRLLFEKYKWKVIRAGASLGEADLICIKNGKSIFLQVKSTKKNAFYFYEYMKDKLEGLPFYLIVDFGYGKVRILPPRKKVSVEDGIALKDFLENGFGLN
jgi:Holliday junction resolvase